MYSQSQLGKFVKQGCNCVFKRGGLVYDVEECREWDRDCQTLLLGWVLDGVLWHLPPSQGSDNLALLMKKWNKREWHWKLWIRCVRELQGVYSGNLLWGQVCEHCPKVPRNCVLFCTLPIWLDISVSVDHPAVQNFFYDLFLFSTHNFGRWRQDLMLTLDGVCRCWG